MRRLHLTLAFSIALLAGTTANADLPAWDSNIYSLADLDAPLGFSHALSDERNKRVLTKLSTINQAVNDWKQDYLSAHTNAVAAQRQLVDAVLASNTAAVQAAANPSTEAWAALAAALQTQALRQQAFEQAVKPWSAQYGRYMRLRVRRIYAYQQLYQHMPVHANFYGVKGVSQFYELKADPTLAAWEEQRNQIFDSLRVFAQNIAQLQADQQVLMDEYSALGARMEAHEEQYQSRLWFDYVNRVGADITASVSNLFTGGPYALVVEAGYQSAEALTWATGLRGSKGMLNDYSWNAPTLPENLLVDGIHAANTLEATELQEAVQRLVGRPDSSLTAAQIRRRAQNLPEPDRAAQGAASGTGSSPLSKFVWGAAPSAGNSMVTPLIAKPLLERNLEGIVTAETRLAVMRSAMQRDLPATAGETVAKSLQPHALLEAMKSRVPEIRNPVAGLGASFAVVAASQKFKEFAAKAGVTLADNMQQAAETEIRWHLKRRQLVAHRLMSERFYENTVANYEAALRVLGAPPAAVLSAKRSWTLKEPLVVDVNPSAGFTLVVETAGFLPSVPVVMMPKSRSVPRPNDQQGPWLRSRSALSNPDVWILGDDIAHTGSHVKEIQVDDQGILGLSGVTLFVYSNAQLGSEIEPPAYPRSFFLDLDPTTPTTHFDDRSMQWRGQDKYATQNSAVRFEFSHPVAVKLRNKSRSFRINPR